MKGLFRKARAGYYQPSSLPGPLGSPCLSGHAGIPEPCRLGVLLLYCHPPVTWWILLCPSTPGHLEVDVVDFCQIPCLNGGRCIGRDECWCPSNSTGKFCHLPIPKLARELSEGGSRHRGPLEGPLKQSTFTLPLSNQLGKYRAGCGPWGHTGLLGRVGAGIWWRGQEAVCRPFFLQSNLPPSPPLSGPVPFPKLLLALLSEFINIFALTPYWGLCVRPKSIRTGSSLQETHRPEQQREDGQEREEHHKAFHFPCLPLLSAK